MEEKAPAKHIPASLWPFFGGILLLMTATGLLGALLGVRATSEEFGNATIGAIMAIYFLGNLSGALVAPALIRRVSSSTALALAFATAACASITHAALLIPEAWIALRYITGLSITVIMVAIEAAINRQTNDGNRGRVLSVYLLAAWLGFSIGPLALNLSDTGSSDLFWASSAMLAVTGAILWLLVKSTEATAPAIRPMSPLRFYRLSPFAAISIFLLSSSYGAIIGYGAVFAANLGLEVRDISLFVAALTGGAMLVQYPLGHISDMVDRRIVLAGTGTLGALVALAMIFAEPAQPILFFGGALLLGGFCLATYPIALAFANDRMSDDERVSGAGAIAFVYGIGAALGPIGASIAADVVEGAGLYLFVMVSQIAMILFAIHRIRKNTPPDHKLPRSLQLFVRRH